MRFKLVKLLGQYAQGGVNKSVAVFDDAKFRWVPFVPLAENSIASLLQKDERLQHDLLHVLCEYGEIEEQLRNVLEKCQDIDFSESFDDSVDEIPFDLKSLRRRSVFEDFEEQNRRKYYQKKKKGRHHVLSKIEAFTNRVPGQFIPDDQYYFCPNFTYENSINVYPSSTTLDVPEGITQLDFEGNVGVVIGNTKNFDEPIRNISPDEAKDYIVGYTVLSHMVSKNIQVRTVDKIGSEIFATTISPEVVTPDEVSPFFQMVKNEFRINDEMINEGSSLYSVFQPEEVVSFASEGTNLVSGEVFSLGCFPNCSGFVNDLDINVQDKIGFHVRVIGSVTSVVGDREGVTHWKRRKPIVHYFKFYRNHITALLAVCLLIIFRKHTWMRFLKKKKKKKKVGKGKGKGMKKV